MKVKFAVEKSMYSNLLMELMSGKEDVNVAAILIKLKTIEEIIQAHDDEIITIVSTKLTYDGPPAAPPMSVEKWNKEKEVVVEVPEEATEPVVIEPSPQCEKCPHKMISHRRKGCRFCDCKEKRPL